MTPLIQKSLKLQLLTSLLLCFALACVTFLIFYFSINLYYLNRFDRESAEAKMKELKRKFQTYVLEKNISSADLEAVRHWAQENRASVFISSARASEVGESHMTTDFGPDGPIFSLSAAIRYRDGEAVVLFSNNHLSAMRFASWVASLLLAFDVFLLSLYFILKKKLGYILRIERGISILESGRLNHTIPEEGADELTRLAAALNLMSNSIQTRIESEQRALAANRQIIGDLSHDIRTPLTVEMGYLMLLLEKENMSKQERNEYLTLALKKAGQIEERTRMLLEFSTLTSGQLPTRKIVIDARMMADQLEEELSTLAELRAEVEIPAGTEINGDTGLLERLFDNLLSNLKRHGDTTCPVSLHACLKDGHVLMKIENAVNKANKKPTVEKGSLLGLKICALILELHEGSFETSATEDIFHVNFSIPIFQKEKQSKN
jgi:signal transduction histidine kinase